MSDEAVVRIVLDDAGGTQPPGTAQTSPPPVATPATPAGRAADAARDAAHDAALVRALQTGGASVWAPPGQAIPNLALKGLHSSQAEYLRMEAEARRRGISVHEYKKQETGAAQGAPSSTAAVETEDDDYEKRRQERLAASKKYDEEKEEEISKLDPFRGAEPPSPAVVPTPDDDDFEKRRAARLAASKKYDEEQAAEIAGLDPFRGAVPPPAPAVVPTSDDDKFEEEFRAKFFKNRAALQGSSTQPPAPPVAQVAPPPVKAEVAAAPVDESERGRLQREIAKRERSNPDPGSPMGKRLAELREELANLDDAVEEEVDKAEPKKAASSLDNLLDAVVSMRGTVAAIGGTFGRIAGVALDIAARVRAIRAQAAQATPTGVPPPTGGAGTGATTAGAAGAAGGAGAASGAGAAATGGPIAAVVAVAVVGVVGAIKSLIDTLNRTAEKYADINPAVAQAQAQVEIRAMMNDIRRAQEFGPELAKFLKAQGELQQRFEDIKINLLIKITPILNGILDAVNWLAWKSREEEEAIIDPVQVILNKELTEEARRGATFAPGGLEPRPDAGSF